MISLLRSAFIVLFLCSTLIPALHADPAYNPLIKIKLAKFYPIGLQEVDITSPNAFSVSDQNGGSIVQAPGGTIYRFNDFAGVNVSVTAASVDADPEQAEAGDSISGLSFTVHSTPGSFITVSSPAVLAPPHHYRGDILIVGGLSIVNSLPLEDYIKGVLKPEIGANAPVEALKAQAIASRTYTVRNLGKMIAAGADMDDTSRTQSYLGEDGETPAIDQAVDDTAGDVLLYNGELINALFCTDCGGMTGDGGPNEPYLAPVADPECASEPPWEIDLSSEQAEAAFGGAVGTSVGDFDIKVNQTDLSGRASQIEVIQGNNKKTITGNQFRIALGNDKLKSTLFKISRENDGSFHIVGQGWGHGLGLCQRGAIYLAQHSALYTDILRHYYTGTVVGELDSSMIDVSPATPGVSSIPQASILTGP